MPSLRTWDIVPSSYRVLNVKAQSAGIKETLTHLRVTSPTSLFYSIHFAIKAAKVCTDFILAKCSTGIKCIFISSVFRVN